MMDRIGGAGKDCDGRKGKAEKKVLTEKLFPFANSYVH
jgi:hypothetical protein